MAGLVSLDQAKTHLNIKSSTNDDEVTHFLEVASDLVEEEAKRVWRDTTFTEYHTEVGGSRDLVLFHSPVKSITSITDNGSTFSGSDYTLINASGLIRLTSLRFVATPAPVAVVYVAGAAAVPLLAQHAALETLRHLWQTQRGTAIRNPLNGDEYTPGTTFSLPQRAVELIAKLANHNGIG